ncbi:hypothetical protein [Maricaulis sp.]|uniref:hypothetical protein n=1 Tax=Maricaulis sp. TaxID=1486257 RepID=UPI000C465416|nr:hypothetical protein [Maricaulis sp.]MAC89690.1 hypothetical protein [Maricaulis sp.]|tara:strand:+ start:98 stop:328 length:231 start_codon:yes stop_codon:yes gene_type:complete
MTPAHFHRPSVTPNSQIDRRIADYKRGLRQATCADALEEHVRVFNLSETRLHLHQSEQAEIERLIARRRRELSEGA